MLMLKDRIKIRLAGGNDQYLHPGQVLHGTVEYRAPTGYRLLSVNIDFRGVTKILPKKGATHINTEYVELFHMGESLLAAPLMIQSSDKNSWDFSFVLPRETGPDRSHGIYQDNGDPHFTERQHILPPSIQPEETPETKVEYNMYVIAKEQYPGQSIPQMSHIQARPVVDVLDSLNLRPDVESLPSAAPQRLEKMFARYDVPKRRFSLRPANSRTNSLSETINPFTVEARVPSTIVPGHDIEIALSIKPSESGSSTQAGAYVHKATTVALEAITHRRTAKQAYSPGLDLSSTTKLEARKGGSGAAKTALPTTNHAAPLTLQFETKQLRALPPSFKSYSLARAYRLLLTTVIVFDKQEYEAIFIAPVQMVYLASSEQVLLRRASVAPPPPPPAIEPWHQRSGVEDDLPPAYEPRSA